MTIVISGRDLERIERAWKKKQREVEISPDLGVTTTRAVIKGDTLLAKGHEIDLAKTLEKKVRRDSCYVLDGNVLVQAKWYDPGTRLSYKLVATSTWPTVKVSGTPMHRHAKTDPKRDTESKIDAIMPVAGKRVLDTCTGLGYTAIVAARKGATLVHTFERDPNIIEMARINPYSRELFSRDDIVLHQEDVTIGIRKLEPATFHRIVHDPPTPPLARELYTRSFYRELYEVAAPGALLYHYLPQPGKLSGRAGRFASTIRKKLEDAGFVDIRVDEEASGMVARKPPGA